MNTHAVIHHIINWLRQYTNEAGSNGFVVGVSGGIDSAVTSSLLARANLPVICCQMPIHQSKDQIFRAKQHIEQLEKNHNNVSSINIELTPVYNAFTTILHPVTGKEDQSHALANTRARIRMTTLYYYASLHRYLVVGTGNKVEDFGVGFFTKYGDGGVDISPIADLVKTEVYQLGHALEVSQDVIDAPPTDGLWEDNRSDEDQIGASYPELEWAMTYDKFPPENQGELGKRRKEVLSIFRRFHNANRHKMVPIPVCVIPDTIKNS